MLFDKCKVLMSENHKISVEIITIGDEILIGQIVDANSAWIGQQLSYQGFKVNQITSISDTKEHITKTIAEAEERASIIIITGGLGPTKDDITKKTLVEYFNSKLVLNQSVLDNIKHLYKSKNRPINNLNHLQAEVPENCIVLMNKMGTAPGMLFRKGKTTIISIPGVPYEMKYLIKEEVIPQLKTIYKPPIIINKTIRTVGIPESTLALKIEKWENELPKNISLAYLPSPGIVKLRLSGIQQIGGDNLSLIIDKQIKKLHQILGNSIYGKEDEKLEEIIGKLLILKDKTLATAESCTGGYIAHLITSISGSSQYFKGSIVSYANEIKENILGVNSKILETKGAVSKEVVTQMAIGVKKLLKTDYAIACSGIAGPTGGTLDKPVGLIWIAIATPNGVKTKECYFTNSRTLNIQLTAVEALNFLRLELI